MSFVCSYCPRRSQSLRTAALTASETKIALKIPTKSTSRSRATRNALRSVSIRRRKDSAGGFLRRTSRGLSTTSPEGVPSGWFFRSVASLVLMVVLRPLQRAAEADVAGLRSAAAGADEPFGARQLDRAGQPLPQRDLRLPVKQRPRPRDVGLADLRIVGGQRTEDDLRRRPRQLEDRLRKLEQRELVRVADVHRLVMPGLGQRDHPADQIVDV